jgi:hypothetical protein
MGINAEYVARMKTQLKRWDEQVDALAARSERADADARAMLQEQVKELRARRDAAQKPYQQLRAAGEAAGEHLRVGMESAWKEMQKALGKVVPR